MTEYTYRSIAKMIDHSLLQQTLTDADMDEGCRLAREYDVASVCIKPYYVARARELLAGSTVAVGTTVGFPHGGHTTSVKAVESMQALKDGATELDMVVNIGKVLSKAWQYVAEDIHAVVEIARGHKALVKVIFENCFLTDEHKEKLCRICGEVRADFVKTSTGYGDTGATDADLKLMRRFAPRTYKSKPPAAYVPSSGYWPSAPSASPASAPPPASKSLMNANEVWAKSSGQVSVPIRTHQCSPSKCSRTRFSASFAVLLCIS